MGPQADERNDRRRRPNPEHEHGQRGHGAAEDPVAETPETVEAFSDRWVQAWARELNQSEAYRSAAATWEGPVALLLDDASPAARRAVLLDLWHGTCRAARVSDPDQLDEARYVFKGSLEAWRHILVDGGSPALALLAGRIRLAKGELASLLPFAGAARELLALAGSVPTRFAEG